MPFHEEVALDIATKPIAPDVCHVPGSMMDLKFLDDVEFSDYVECLLDDSLSSKDPRTHSTNQFNAMLEGAPDYFITSPGVLLYSQLYHNDQEEFRRFNKYFANQASYFWK